MRKILIVPVLFTVMLILSACSSDGFKADYKLEVKPFTFTNHEGEEVSLDDLKGDVWIAQFIFTNCTTFCGPMMHNMAELQDALIEEGVEDYKIVSFTVDPKVDSPEVLKDYLKVFAPKDESKWEMLTGFKQDEIIELAKKSFYTMVANDPNSDQVVHGGSFILVDQNGNTVKLYDGVGTPEEPFVDKIDDIVKDMKALIKRGA